MLANVFAGNFSNIRKRAVPYFSLLKADFFLKRGLREMADNLYDLEFGSLPSLDRRIYECFSRVDADIRWMHEHDQSGNGIED